jgi:DNA gyrase/topoisomerase IV subunit B
MYIHIQTNLHTIVYPHQRKIIFPATTYFALYPVHYTERQASFIYASGKKNSEPAKQSKTEFIRKMLGRTNNINVWNDIIMKMEWKFIH